MAELLWSLQDSQLVARFQRRCGLFPALDEGPGENGAGPADGEAQTPELGHLPAAKGKGAGEPANGLRRLAAPQLPLSLQIQSEARDPGLMQFKKVSPTLEKHGEWIWKDK